MSKYHNEKSIYISKVTIVVSDLNRSIDFYTNLLGFSVLNRTEDVVELTVNNKDAILVLKEVKNALRSEDNIGLYHFAILIPNRGSMAQILQQLISREYPLTGLSDHGISDAIYLQDPDNNGIEIAIDRFDESGNVLKLEAVGPKRMDYMSYLKELPSGKFTKLPTDVIMGHLHLHVENIEKAKRFFVEGLEFDIILDFQGRAVFVSSQGYHHHLGFNIWNGANARRRLDNQAGLESYVLKVPQSEYEKVYKRLTDMKYEVKKDDSKMVVNDVNGDTIFIESH